jgi:drug/metabolite transporter (DMT)-like permease
LALGLFLPLAAIHLWVATARDGLLNALKRIGAVLGRAFSPQSVLIYLVGFLIFAVVPYFLLFRTTPNKHAWLELSLLSVRLAVVFGLTLIGWLITVKAISLLQSNQIKPVTNEAA